MSNQNSERQLPAFLPVLALLGSFAILLVILLPQPAQRPATTPTATSIPPTVEQISPTTVPPTAIAAAYDPAVILQGSGIFQSTCVACHGFDGRGIPGLGKNLIESEFMHGLTDAELLSFIIIGRDISDPLNTTGVPMPARGGNPTLTDDQISAIIAYLRSQSSAPAVAQSQATAAPTTAVEAPSEPTAAVDLPVLLPTTIPVTVPPFTAEAAYNWSCAGCHGADGSGNDPYGPGFLASNLLQDRAALQAFLAHSQPAVDPAVEYPHPARGGYPPLTDEQIDQLIDYLLTVASE